jgi:hypothetical protein
MKYLFGGGPAIVAVTLRYVGGLGSRVAATNWIAIDKNPHPQGSCANRSN